MTRTLTPDVVRDICVHMNEDHADAVARYATVFAKCAEVERARMLSMDAEGMDLEVSTSAGTTTTARVLFDHAVADADDARATLIALAREASGA
jgi:putative heme iron utilization protein